jgi:uncharacterized protein YraI
MSLKRTALTFGIAVAALVGSTVAALAVPAFATSNVNVRTGAGTGYGVVDVLRRGERVDIDYCRGSWCFVNKSGPDGWVSASYLSRDRYDDDFYDDDDDFYIDEGPFYRPYRPYRPYFYRPRSSACIGGPNASFCITN